MSSELSNTESFKAREIIVAVCGGIAAYKIADVVSKLAQAGAGSGAGAAGTPEGEFVMAGVAGLTVTLVELAVTSVAGAKAAAVPAGTGSTPGAPRVEGAVAEGSVSGTLDLPVNTIWSAATRTGGPRLSAETQRPR